MKKIISTLLLIVVYFGYGHDIKMAIFEISQEGSGLMMSASLDKEDFLKTLHAEFPDKYSSGKIEELALDYLNNRLAIYINGEGCSIDIQNIEYSDLNIHIKGSLNLNIEKVNEVKIHNTCMVDLFEDHDNIIKLKLNDRTRSFRLNKDRISTTASYE